MNNCGIFLLIIFCHALYCVVRSQHMPRLKCMFSSHSKLSLDLEFSTRAARHTYQADNLAKLWLELLSVPKTDSKDFLRDRRLKSKQGSWQYARLRVAIASATIFSREMKSKEGTA